MRTNFSQRALGQRIIALAAAYLIALAGLIASFSAARVAAEAIADPLGIICHTAVTGQPSPASDEGNSKICSDRCSVGCLMLMAALSPPPVKSIAVPQLSGQAIEPIAVITFDGDPKVRSHQSRAPPQTA